MTAVHKMTGDFYDDPYDLVALHSSLEDYELVYFLNLHLNSRFVRCREDLVLSPKCSFPIFEWKDLPNDLCWTLMPNSNVREERVQPSGLFEGEPSRTIQYLIPECKEVDYFLKIEQYGIQVESEVLKLLLHIPKIVTAYVVAANNLKSRNNLIFL